MDDFTDFGKLDIEELASDVITAFGERYLTEAMRVVATGVVLPDDAHMIHMSLYTLIGLYMKQVKSGETTQNKVIH